MKNKEEYEIIFRSNIEHELEVVEQALLDHEIEYKIERLHDNPIFGQNKKLWENEIWIKKEDFQIASELIDKTTEELSNTNQEPAKIYPDLSDYYNKIFKRFDEETTYFNTSWNWAAFVFSWLWYLYHKMYVKSAIILALEVGLILWLGAKGFIFAFFIIFFCGLHGNYHKYEQYKSTSENS
ncbi:MAG: DUF2628 domain-containing protein [Spirochaetales bacterium]|nr:DUF2628 domain-containing protein [Spirochaetales bacterium]